MLPSRLGDIAGAGHLTQAIVSLLASTGDTQAAPSEAEVQTLKRQSAIEYNPVRKRQLDTDLSLALARRDRRTLYLARRKWGAP